MNEIMKHKLMILTALIFAAVIVLIPLATVAEVTYSGAAFREIGLPNGTLWGVNCNGQQYQSNSSIINITLSPGTYTYQVLNVSGYTASPQNGTVTAILDPIKLTDITFSSTIPEFAFNQATMAFLILAILIASMLTIRLKRR